MLYLLGIIRRDGGTEGDKEISSRLWMLSAKLVIISVLDMTYPQEERYLRFMITHLFLPFLLFKVVVLNFLTLEHDSATHDVVVVVHGIFLLDFSFEVCNFSVQLFQLEGEDTVFGSVLIWSSVEEGRGGG